MPDTKDLRDLDSQIKLKTISASSFKKGSSVDIAKDIKNIHKTMSNLAGIVRRSVIRVSNLEKIVQNNSKKITSLKNISRIQSGRISGTNIGAKLSTGPEDNLNKNVTIIAESVTSIVEILKKQSKLQKESEERARKERETSKRASAESKLEKGFSAAIRVAERVLAPVKSLLSRIIDFFMAIFWGKVFLKLLDWFADPNNKKKINSLFRFFNDHWPKLLALYLRFGTGLGRFVGGLTRVVFFGTRKLLQIVAQLVGAKAAARFLGGRGGKLVSAGLQVATTVGTTMALGSGIEKFVGKGESEKTPKVPNYFGGGLVNMFRGIKGFFGGGPGFVSGQKGVDKIPAMLSDGEFVMSRGAVQKYGVGTLESMNAAGGGTNKPRMISGTTYAAGGGLVGNSPDFWSIAAISAREAGHIPQGQADIAQSIYNRVQLGIHPGGRNIKNIITAPQQYAPTFSNPGAWKSIIDRGTAVKAVGKDYASRLDMSAKSITNPKLQKEAARFVGSRTDFRGESQKKHMDQKKGDITRGSGHNFFGWMTDNAYSSRLPQPAPVPKVISSKQLSSTSSSTPTKSSSPGMLERFSSGLSSLTRGISSLMSPTQSTKVKEPRYAKGGMVGGSHATISKNPVKARNISPPSRPPVVVRALDTSGAQNMSVPRAGGSPQVPSFAVSFNENRERVLAIHGIA